MVFVLDDLTTACREMCVDVDEIWVTTIDLSSGTHNLVANLDRPGESPRLGGLKASYIPDKVYDPDDDEDCNFTLYDFNLITSEYNQSLVSIGKVLNQHRRVIGAGTVKFIVIPFLCDDRADKLWDEHGDYLADTIVDVMAMSLRNQRLPKKTPAIMRDDYKKELRKEKEKLYKLFAMESPYAVPTDEEESERLPKSRIHGRKPRDIDAEVAELKAKGEWSEDIPF